MAKNTKESVMARRVPSVTHEDCMEWTGATNAYGYGVVGYEGKPQLVHRLVYQWEHPGVSMDGLVVMHTCDNPLCSNPAHLVLGTTQDNVQDRVNKGRTAQGTSHYRSKLTESAVRAVRELRAFGMSGRKVGELFNINQSQVCRIEHHQSYASL